MRSSSSSSCFGLHQTRTPRGRQKTGPPRSEPLPAGTTMRRCRGQTCVWVLEWHGPDASAEAIGVAQNVAESIELKTTWAGGTPILSRAKVGVGS
jgi:hypothetical protein